MDIMKSAFNLVFFFACISSYCQPEVEWGKTFGGSDLDGFFSVASTSDHGYIMAGASKSEDGDVEFNSGNYDSWIVKLSSEGDLEWQKTIGLGNVDRARSIIKTPDGEYIVVGLKTLMPNESILNQSWVIKLSNTGELLWERLLGENLKGAAIKVIMLSDGNYLVASERETTSTDVALTKITMQGEVIWDRIYGGNGINWIRSIIETKDGGIAFAGTTETNNDVPIGSRDFWVVKLNSQGTIEWSSTFGGTSSDGASSIIETEDNRLIVVGHSSSSEIPGIQNSNNGGALDVVILRLNEDGNFLEGSFLGGSLRDLPNKVIQHHDGSFILCGHSNSGDGDLTINEGEYDAWLLNLDHDLNIKWQKSIGGSENDYCSDMIVVDNEFSFVGTTSSSDHELGGNQGRSDGWIVKLNLDKESNVEDPQKLYSKVYPNPTNSEVCLDLQKAHQFILTDSYGKTICRIFQKKKGRGPMLDRMPYWDAVLQMSIVWILTLIGAWIWNHFKLQNQFSKNRRFLRKKNVAGRIIDKSKGLFASFEDTILTNLEGDFSNLKIEKNKSANLSIGDYIEVNLKNIQKRF